MLTGTLFEMLLADPEVSTTFVIRLWQAQGLLGVMMQGLCLDVGEVPHVAFTGAGVAAAEADHRTATRDCYMPPKPQRDGVPFTSATPVVLCPN